MCTLIWSWNILLTILSTNFHFRLFPIHGKFSYILLRILQHWLSTYNKHCMMYCCDFLVSCLRIYIKRKRVEWENCSFFTMKLNFIFYYKSTWDITIKSTWLYWYHVWENERMQLSINEIAICKISVFLLHNNKSVL